MNVPLFCENVLVIITQTPVLVVTFPRNLIPVNAFRVKRHKDGKAMTVVVKLNWPRFCIQASIFALTRSVSAH
ncbi:hypothetical protein, partial [Shewanella algae]|uniref:hypothetical protein n=1 Tax=Shewanella algae TaxID=38313 RepID=UPI001C593A86